MVANWALAALLAGPAAAQGIPVGWNETLSPHFQVLHEAPFAPPGLVLDLEAMHNRLRRELAMFAPWMAKERVRIHLHKDRSSYLKGPFQPPDWSNGMAYYDRRIVVTYVQPDRAEMLEVLGHEMTHLFFESYWGEARKAPPTWLNEGLAMLEEWPDPETEERSDWGEAMRQLAQTALIPFKRFVEINPARDLKDRSAVTWWYVQSYAAARFLLRRHSRLQFHNFCRLLRDGEPLKKALWQAYRYQSEERFEAEWRKWLGMGPAPAGASARALAPKEQAEGGGRKLKAVEFREFRFHGLLDRRKQN